MSFVDEAMSVTKSLLGRDVFGGSAVAGRSHVARLATAAGSVIAVRRANSRLGATEAMALGMLRKHGAPVPLVLGEGSGWLVQEDLGGERLSSALAGVPAEEALALLGSAAEGLVAIQRAGREAGLERYLPVIGARQDWRLRAVAMIDRVGQLSGVLPPATDAATLARRLQVREPRFVKWDARPGNAIVRSDGSLVWFDFEHSGIRNPLDDFVWLLGDEYAPDLAGIEDEILTYVFAQPDVSPSRDQGEAYFAAFVTVHVAVRLALILSKKGDGEWWDERSCLEDDKVGVTQAAFLRLCRRGAGWSSRLGDTEALSSWFRELAERVSAVP